MNPLTLASRRAAGLTATQVLTPHPCRALATSSAPPGRAGAKESATKKGVARERKSSASTAAARCVQSRNAAAGQREAPFVSGHFRLPSGAVVAYLERHGVKFRRSGTHVVIERCPFCHDLKGQASNMYKNYVETSTGVYFCHRCGVGGSWYALRERISGVVVEPISPVAAGVKRPRGRPKAGVVARDLGAQGVGSGVKMARPQAGQWDAFKANLVGKYPAAKDYLVGKRGLRIDVLEKYGVGADMVAFGDSDGSDGGFKDRLCLLFPMFDGDRKLARFKIRGMEHKEHMRLAPKGGSWGMFGLDTVPEDAEEVILTEGEFDAMAAYQATGKPAVSLPNGARSLPVDLLPALERFKKIYLWMDDDVPGQEGADHFSKKLGLHRCFIVRTNSPNAACKDANDALLHGHDLNAMLAKATTKPHEGVATFNDLRDELYVEFTNPQQASGVQSKLLPRLNNLIKGHRRGELTIYSGHTGVGKTTLLAQQSLDYCMQGVPTLWGSFEISNVRIAKLLLSQYYAQATGNSPMRLAEDFNEWADKFSTLPMYFMRYFGSNPIERVLDAMEYGNYVYDCSHVLLDNLQFMTSGQARGYDRFEVMDTAVEKLRMFSTSNNVHVSLVVHPRKENDDQAIQTASVFGTAKATQEADNIVILQRTLAGPVLDVRKNRFDGKLGTLNLHFNPSSKLFEERASPLHKKAVSKSRPASTDNESKLPLGINRNKRLLL